MKLRIVCLLVVWACVYVTGSRAMAVLSDVSSSGESGGLEEASRMAHVLKTIVDSIHETYAVAGDDDDDSAEDDDEDATFFRRRPRMYTGSYYRYQGSGGRNNRPRVYIPRTRPGNKGSSRNNVSPY